MDTERSRIIALIGYFLAGIAGFTLGVWILWDNLEAGPHRFVLGAATLLAIGAVGLTLLHYYNHRTPGYSHRTPGYGHPRGTAIELRGWAPNPNLRLIPSKVGMKRLLFPTRMTPTVRTIPTPRTTG